MLFVFLLFFFAFGSNEAISVKARGEYPPHLSFKQYRGILSFASDDDTSYFNELETNENEEQTTTTTMTTTIWDSLLSDTLDNAENKKAMRATGYKNNNQNYKDTLFPFIACHSDMSEMHGAERYNVLESILARGQQDLENDQKFFIKRVPIYNNNIKSKTSNDEDDDTLYGTCFYSTIELILAKNIQEKEILLTPVAPFLKMRKNISSSKDYDEKSIDKDTISLSVMLAPGIFSSHDKAVGFASNLQELENMDQNNPFFTECDTKPYQRSFVNIGFSETSYFLFYEFETQDLKAGITHRCHRLFLEYIVTKPQVISVEKVAKNTISNHHARWTVESGTKDYRPFSGITGLNGNGETVFVADTGLDEQHCYLRDYDGNTVESTTGWDVTNKIDRSLRKVIQYIELDDIDSDRTDSNGHGTHIVASIVGKRLESGVEVDGLGDGVANGALISFYDGNNVLASEDGDTLSISVNSIISQFFYFGRMAEAKIASASWNSGEFGEYDEKTRQVDEYFYNDPDDLMLMFNSAGNEGGNNTGSDYGTTKYPCISKNVLCVGASLNYHSDLSKIDEVASFSSYGPTKDGRIKPDIVSPGGGILSANAGFNGCGPESYPESVDYDGVNHDGLVFKRGTSMACPIAAGAGALVRQYFADGYYPSGEKENDEMQITGSLLKAILVNGAVELKRRSKPGGGYEDSEYYDRYQGFGRINLLTSLKHADNEDSPDLYAKNERNIEKGQTHEYVFENVCNDHEFRATLVWRDPPSDSGCNECLVNDLDLEVDYDGNTYYPNGRDGPEEKNNVERIILEVNKLTNPTGNTIRVKVKTANLGVDVEQKYSLASTGCFDSNEVELIGFDSDSKCEDDEFGYTIDIFTNRKPEETNWILKKQGSDEVIASVTAGEYEEDVDRLKSFRYKGCITDGCYIFIIKDTAFDGLCCEKGMGSYSIRVDDEIRFQSDSFVNRQEIQTFCNYGLLGGAEPTTSPTVLSCNDDEFKYQIDIKTDLNPDETRWVLLRKPRIDGVYEGSYTKRYTDYIHEGCLDISGCFSFSVYGGSSYGEYTVKANEFVVAEREGFLNENIEEFCYSEESNATPTYGIRTAVVGSYGGEPFDDVHPLWQYGKIKEIELYADTSFYKFYFIGITYESGHSFEHGWKDGTQRIISLGENQYITKVSGQVNVRIKQLKFETNDGKIFGPYPHGDVSGSPFEFDFGDSVLVYIFGRTDGEFIFQLGFTYASLPQTITDSPTAQPTSLPCGDDQFRYEIKIRTGYNPEEIWWELYQVIDSVPFMTYKKQLETYSHTGCLTIDENYKFQMIDKRRDGLCCYFGSGSYRLSVDNNVVVRGNHFDDANLVGEWDNLYLNPDFFVYNKHEFSYSSTLQPTSKPIIEMTCGNDEFEYWIRVRTHYLQQYIGWDFKNSNGDIIESVEEGEYYIKHYEHNHKGCLPLNECFEFFIIAQGGLCCYYGNGGYKIFANDVVMAEGGETVYNENEIYWRETKTFCYGPSYSSSPSSYPTTLNPTVPLVCEDNEFKYEVIVTTDEYPTDTAWYLIDEDLTLIIDGVDFGEYTQGNTEHVHRGCLDLDSCVFFIIYDSYGDGILGNGGYTIMANNNFVMTEGGEFDYYYYEVKTFCYGPSYSQSPSYSFSPSVTKQMCENGSNNHDWCGWWASIGLCEDNHVKDWMQEHCTKACSNCCMDYSDYEFCDYYYYEGRCTDTSIVKDYAFTWQEYMQATCRYSCDTCDLDVSPSPTPSPVTCSDDQFKYEIVVTNDDTDYNHLLWDLYYKYPDLTDGSVDGNFGQFPPNYEKKYYGCASYSCFDLELFGGYVKMYNMDKNILIAQNTERMEQLRFCNYAPEPTTLQTTPQEAIFTIFLEFSTSQSNAEDISNFVRRSVMKILFHAQIDDENIVTIILDGSCETDSKICDIIIQICKDICGGGEEPDFLSFVGNTMNEVEANGQLLQTIKATANHMDVGILDSLTQVSILYDFDYDPWPTTSPTTLPSSITSTQDCCNTPGVMMNLFNFITDIFQPVTQAITNTTDPISYVLFGVESYNSSDITCADKMFELQLEIKTDGSPEKTSWELLYENGTTIESIGRDTYSECDTVYNYSYCLDTSCFVFNMFDSLEFKGSYNITVGDTVLAQQDSFMWWKESRSFCYPQCDDDDMFALQIQLMTDDWPQETSWNLTFDNGAIVDYVGERYYTGRNTVYNHRYCLYDDSRYNVTFHDHIGDGICCSYGEGFFKMKINDEIVKEEGEFENVTSFSFPNNEEEVSCEGCNGASLIEIITNVLSRQTNKM